MPERLRPPAELAPEALVTAARAIVRLSRRLEVALAEIDLTLSQYRVLVFLANGESRPSNIAPNIHVTRPTVTALLDGLVSRGYVDRQPDEVDRRRVRHRVTPAGKRALVEADRAVEASLRSLGERLAPKTAHTAIESLAWWHGAIDDVLTQAGVVGVSPLPSGALTSPSRRPTRP